MRHLSASILIALAIAVSACGQTRPLEVQTSRPNARELPLPKEEGAFHFVIFGDRTGGPVEGIQVLAQAVEDANLLDPDLVLTVGDLVQGYNETPQWLEQMEEYRAVMAGLDMPWYPVAGNHDVYWPLDDPPPGHHEANYETNFGPLWYWFGQKNAAFIVLYTDEGDRETNSKGYRKAATTQMSPEQLTWLESALAETANYDHVFVFLHHPRWITGSYPESNWETTHQLLAEAGNVTAVFAGHIHRQRYDGLKDGIAYYTLAATGGSMPMDLPGTGWLHHMNQVVVRKDAIEVATIPVGVVLDPEEMTPERLGDINAARTLLPIPLSAPIWVSADGPSQGEAIYQVENQTSRPLEVRATVKVAAGDWRIEPDHNHKTLAPGETGELRFALERPAGRDSDDFSFPELVWQVDFLGERRRISLPERSRLIALHPSPRAAAAPSSLPNRALAVDGRNSMVWIPPETVNLPDGPFTLEAWFRADSVEGKRAVAGKTENSEYNIMLEDGHLQFFVHLDGEYSRALAGSQDAVSPARWHHAAGVFDGQELRLYLDGRLIDRVEASGSRRVNDMPFLVGAEPGHTGGANYDFEGMIDEVRVSTVPRYHGEAFVPARRHEADEETFLLLHLDGLEAPLVLDSSGKARHGILAGKARFAPLDPARLTTPAAGS